MVAPRFSSGRSLIAALLACCGAAAPSLAAVINWGASVSGLASNPASWAGGVVPGVSDSAVFGGSLQYTVTFDAGASAFGSHLYNSNVVQLQFNIPHSTNSVTVTSLAANIAATTRVLGGDLSCSDLTVNSPHGALCTLTINGGSHVTAEGPLTLGVGGRGRCFVNSGVLRVDEARIGAGLNGNGDLTATGPDSRFEVIAGGLDVGNGAAGALTLGGGAGAEVFGNVRLGAGVPAAGPTASSLYVGNNLIGEQAVMDIHGDLNVGTRTGIAAGSTATLEIPFAGEVSVDGTTQFGDAFGNHSRLTIREGGLLISRSIVAPAGSSADLRLDGGTTVVNGGFFDVSTMRALVIGSHVGTPVLEFRDGAQGTFTALPADRAMTIASSGAATLRLSSNAAVDTTSGSVMMGEAPGALGAIDVSDNAELLLNPAGQLMIGQGGGASMTINSGGDVFSGRVGMAALLTGTSNVDVNGTGSLWNITGSLDVSGGLGIAGGAANLTVRNNAQLVVNGGPTDAVRLSTGARVHLNSATMNSSLPVRCINAGGLNVLDMTGASLFCSVLEVGGSVVTANGLIGGGVNLSDADGHLDLTNNLTISLGATQFISGPGSLRVGSHTLTVTGQATPLAGSTSVAGGTILSVQQLSLPPNGLLSGFGTLNCDLTFPASPSLNGLVLATSDGFTISRTVSSPRLNFAGTRTTIGAGGTLSGGGLVNTEVVGATGSLIAVTSDATLGLFSSATGFLSDGAFTVTNATATVRDLDSASARTTTLDGGTIDAPNGWSVDIGQTLSGNGTVRADVRNAGTVLPGGASIGVLSVEGDFTNRIARASGAVRLDVCGPAAQDADRLNVDHAASLGGRIEVAFCPAFVPHDNFQWEVLGAQSVNGIFATEVLPPGAWLEYTPTAVIFHAPCVGDFNRDGSVDGDDVIALFERWDAGHIAADVNGDDGVDGDDIIFFFEHWDAGC